jgi:hypothetical protein
MLDFKKALFAQQALEECVTSILGDMALSTADMTKALADASGDFAQYTGRPVVEAGQEIQKIVRKYGGDRGAARARADELEAIRKARPKAGHAEEARRTDANAAESAERAAAARRKLQTTDDEEEPNDVATKASLNEAMHELALSKRQAGETAAQAFTRFVQTDPGGQAMMRKYLRTPDDGSERVVPIRKASPVELAPVQSRVEALAAEIRKANPRLSIHQARARAYDENPGLLRKAMAEARGYDDGPEAA